MRTEAVAGTLEPGKAADFCALDINPFADGLGGCARRRGVSQTWVGGRKK
jgi:imidazolonepropionase-like amidohydrolase